MEILKLEQHFENNNIENFKNELIPLIKYSHIMYPGLFYNTCRWRRIKEQSIISKHSSNIYNVYLKRCNAHARQLKYLKLRGPTSFPWYTQLNIHYNYLNDAYKWCVL